MLRGFEAKLAMPVRIKICGITRAGDGEAAARLGAHAVGLVFAPKSPRCLTVETARTISQALPPFVCRTGVFQDLPADEMEKLLAAVHLDLLQFHGDESAAYCARWQRPWIKAVPMASGAPAASFWCDFAGASGFLFDAHQSGESGGKGELFDWSKLPAQVPAPVILAGGLTPENVFAAIRATSPYAVDVSSGVESSPGIKDENKIAEFIAQVKRAEYETV